MSKAAPMSETHNASSPGGVRPLLIVAGVGVVLVLAALALWAHYGTVVFFEMFLAGMALCL